MDEARVKCKQCGRLARPSEYVLDPVYRIMVCPMCVKDRRMREQIHREVDSQRLKKKKEQEELMKDKPAGWDPDDDAINRAYKAKLSKTVQVEEISKDIVKYPCPKCKYSFRYNTAKRIPSKCPYCGAGVQSIRY